MPVSVATAPPVEPVTLAEARDHLRLEASGSPASHPDDTLVEGLIQAAREHAESFMRRTIIETEYTWSFDDFPTGDGAIVFPRNAVLSVSSVAYTDDDGNSQTFTDYTLSRGDSHTVMVPGHDKDWPDNRGHTDDVTITFKAGYQEVSGDYRVNVPESIRRAILLLVGHLYENRESVVIGDSATEVPYTVKSLLWPHRVLGL